MKSVAFVALLLGTGITQISRATTPGNQDKASILARQLKSSDPKRRLDAVRKLHDMGPKAVRAADALLGALTGDDPKLRGYAARALGKLGSKGITALVTALEHTDLEVRRAAAESLSYIGPSAKDAVPALVKALRDSDLRTARYAAQGLGEMGPEAAQAKESLKTALEDERLLPWAAKALIKVAPAQTKEWVKRVPEFLGSPDIRTRGEAALALVAAGPLAKDALPALVKALADENSGIRRYCARAIGGLGPLAKSAVPELISALSDEGAAVRYDSAKALGAIGPGAAEAIPALKRTMADTNGAVANAAKVAIKRITSPVEPKAPVVRKKPPPGHGMPPVVKPPPPERQLPALLSGIAKDLAREVTDRTKQCAVFVLDDSMGMDLEKTFWTAWRTAFEGHPLRQEKRFYVGIVVLSQKPYVALRPTNNLDRFESVLKRVSRTENKHYKNTMEAVRLAAVLARNVSGKRAVILYSNDNADSEDHLEPTLAILKAGRTKFYAITPEAVYSDHYWRSYGYDGKRTKILDPAGGKPIDLGYAIHGEESPLIEFPFQWIYTGIFPKTVQYFGIWDGNSPLLVPSGFTFYAPARLARETGGKVYLCPNAQPIPSFCKFVECSICAEEHDACDPVYDETKIKVTAPSLQSRADYMNSRNVDSLQAMVIRIWWEAYKLKLVTAVPPLKISASNRLSLNKSDPNAKRYMFTGVPWYVGSMISRRDWRTKAQEARKQAEATGELIERMGDELSKVNPAGADKRWLATAEALRVCLMVSRMNLLQWAVFCGEQENVKPTPGRRFVVADVWYSFCHGGKAIVDAELCGGDSLRGNWKSLCAAVDKVAERHRGTPWEILVRRTLILKWEIKISTPGRGGSSQTRARPSRGSPTSNTPGAPTRPGRSNRGGSSSGSTRTGGSRP